MTADLAMTNTWLAVLAVVATFEAIAIVALCLCGLLFYRRVMRMLAGIEERHVAPVATRVNAILDDVQRMTSMATLQAEQFERFVQRVVGSWWQRGDRQDRREDGSTPLR